MLLPILHGSELYISWQDTEILAPSKDQARRIRLEFFVHLCSVDEIFGFGIFLVSALDTFGFPDMS